MDDEDHGEYSRAPKLDDLLAVCRALNAEGVRKPLLIRMKDTLLPSDHADVQFLLDRIVADEGA